MAGNKILVVEDDKTLLDALLQVGCERPLSEVFRGKA